MRPNQFNDSRISGVCMAKRIHANRWRVTPRDAAERFAERNEREAADTRTEAQRWLGDPPPGRSALARVGMPDPSQFD
jgi:hypothetical protein